MSLVCADILQSMQVNIPFNIAGLQFAIGIVITAADRGFLSALHIVILGRTHKQFRIGVHVFVAIAGSTGAGRCKANNCDTVVCHLFIGRGIHMVDKRGSCRFQCCQSGTLAGTGHIQIAQIVLFLIRVIMSGRVTQCPQLVLIIHVGVGIVVGIIIHQFCRNINQCIVDTVHSADGGDLINLITGILISQCFESSITVVAGNTRQYLTVLGSVCSQPLCICIVAPAAGHLIEHIVTQQITAVMFELRCEVVIGPGSGNLPLRTRFQTETVTSLIGLTVNGAIFANRPVGIVSYQYFCSSNGIIFLVIGIKMIVNRVTFCQLLIGRHGSSQSETGILDILIRTVH